MAGAGGPLRLRDWLVAQIESGRYAGLCWEDADKTLFRIPWKHAARQGYRAQQDAALFRAWAIHKGKHLEGIDKEDPPTWKTRLRCALNKSADFCEVRERSHRDSSSPYKVYRIVAHGAHGPGARACAPPENNIPRKQQEPPGEVTELACGTDQVSCPSSPPQSCQLCHLSPELPSVFSALSCVLWHCPLPQLRSFPVCPLLHPCPSRQLHLFLPGPHLPRHLQLRLLFPSPPSSLGPPVLSSSAVFSLITLCNLFPDIHPWPLSSSGYQAQDPTHHWSPLLSEDFSNPDCWLHVRLFYGGKLVRETTTRVAEGCRLSPQAVTAAERLLGQPRCMAQVRFPEPPPGARVLERLLRHLERGVLLWVAPEGVFAKRLCRGRVYWRGPLAPHRAQPNKLERERTCQLLDTLLFLEELRAHLQDGRQEPEYQIRLCFGEEYPGPPEQLEERLIMAHVEPVFARELFLHWKRHYSGVPASPTVSLTC
ncbi:interferon regulatory factor 4-like [Neovison vison]|uniref:interferon regulatory factor 4-like n=1 Tax=Neovison vison TaxID=452646 RepID=UPI001CF0731F|nr:interferon regulatory factor 4-like [Neogale vison]